MKGLREIRADNTSEGIRKRVSEVRYEAESNRIITFMLNVVQNELDGHSFAELQALHPELKDLTEERVREFVAAGRLF